MINNLKYLFLFLVLVGHPDGYARNFSTLAVVGDSSAVGYFAHPDHLIDRDRMWQIFRAQYALNRSLSHLKAPEAFGLDHQNAFDASVRVMRGVKEYSGPMDLLLGQFKLLFDYHYLTIQEYSWPYLLGKKWGVKGKDILVAAAAQASIKDASSQVARILEANQNQVPQHVIFSFLSDDLCAPLLRMLPSSDTYEDHLKESILYLLRRGELGADGATIYLPVFLNLMQIIDDEALLNKEVNAHATTMSCRELHDYSDVPPLSDEVDAQAQMFFRLLRMPSSPAQICPTLFARNLDRGSRVSGQEQLSMMANRARAYRQSVIKLAPQLEEIASEQGWDVRFKVLTRPGEFRLSEQHLAQDCFHLSVLGQEALASGIYDELTNL